MQFIGKEGKRGGQATVWTLVSIGDIRESRNLGENVPLQRQADSPEEIVEPSRLLKERRPRAEARYFVDQDEEETGELVMFRGHREQQEQTRCRSKGG